MIRHRGVLAHIAPVMAWVLAACGGADVPSGPPVLVEDSAGVVIVTNDLAQLPATCSVSAEPSVVIGSAAGAPEYQLHRVFGARQLSDGRIVLVNQGSQELRFYDEEGRFRKAAGRGGEGPGEFLNAFHLWVMPGDTIWVGDYAPWQFEIFSSEGEWVRALRPRPEYINPPAVISVLDGGRSVLADREFVGASAMGRFEPLYLSVLLHGADGALADTVGRYPNGSQGRFPEWPTFLASPHFQHTARAAAAGSRVVSGHTSTPEIHLFTVDGTDRVRLERIVRWTAAPVPVTPADVEAERDRITASLEELEPAMREQLLSPQIDPRRPFESTFPIFSGISMGRDGRIWVREYRRPDAAEMADWLVFDADGTLVCRGRTPLFSQMSEFGTDYLLVVSRDEMGVEQVMRFGLGEPEGE